MMPNFEHYAIFTSHSNADLRAVCRALTQILALPLFDFPGEDFALAENETLRVEIARDDEFRVSFSWNGDSELGELMQRVLENILDAPVTRR